MTSRGHPTSVSAALSLVQQLHVVELERWQQEYAELQREVQYLRMLIPANGMGNGHGNGNGNGKSDTMLEQHSCSNRKMEGISDIVLEDPKSSEKLAALKASPSGTALPQNRQITPTSPDSPNAPELGNVVESEGLAERGASSGRIGSASQGVASYLKAATRMIGPQDTDTNSSTDSDDHEKTSMQQLMMRAGSFDMAMGVIILLNAAAIGYDATLRAENEPAPEWMGHAEIGFLVVYCLEFLARFAVGRFRIFRSSWIILDLFLLACGLADVILRGLLGSQGEGTEFLDQLMVMRVLRLARVARVFRLVSAFRTLWVLVNGLFHSLITLLWTFVLIFIIMYCFAIFAIEVIREEASAGEEYNYIVREHFGNLFKTCLTLLQGVTLDSVGGIYKPIIETHPWLVLYFCSFIFIVSIALMNLVTAIMVESALDQSKQDRALTRERLAAKRKKQVGELKQIFIKLDADGSEMLSYEELKTAPADVKENLLDITECDDLEELFKMLDYDEDGQVTIEEFCEGVEKVAQGKLELLNITRLAREVLRQTGKILEGVHGEEVSLQKLLKKSSDSKRGGSFARLALEPPPTSDAIVVIRSEPGHNWCEL